MRFYHCSEISFSNDELSAILRLGSEDFSSLINEGVRPDGHPAFTQVVLWLMGRTFGMTEGSLRFLPIVASVLALLWTYLLGKKCFSANAGLFAAAALVFLDYVLTHSYIARPYPFGLCFTIMFAYSWYLLLYEHSKRTWLKVAFFGIAAALCMYTHYFAFLNAIIIGISGLFLLNKDNWKGYLTASLLAVALFTPHFGILFDQIAVGGVGGPEGWLSAPDGTFFGKYIKHAFNDSGWILLMVVGLAVLLYKLNTSKSGSRFHAIMVAWFLGPFIVGYAYSVLRNPVLQPSTLIFSFPFLLLALFSFAGKMKKGWLVPVLLVAFIGLGSFHTIVKKQYYSTHHFGVFKQIAEANIEWQKGKSASEITQVINVNNPFYVNHYLDRYDAKIDFAQTRIDNSQEELQAFIELVRTCKSDFFSYSWSSKYSAEEIYDIILEHYGTIVDDRKYFNSRATLFKRGNAAEQASHKYISEEKFNSDGSRRSAWNFDPKRVLSGGKYLIQAQGFDVNFVGSVRDLMLRTEGRVRVNMSCKAFNSGSAELVMTLNRNGEIQDYHSYRISTFMNPDNGRGTVYLNRVYKMELLPDDELKVYIWNPELKTIEVNSATISTHEN